MFAKLIGGAALACALALPALASPAATAVKIDNFVFGPAEVVVPVGATVSWTNNDDIPHTIVAEDKSFRSKVLDTGESYSFTFKSTGSYGYFCSLHPHMTGKIVV